MKFESVISKINDQSNPQEDFKNLKDGLNLMKEA
jgi:hypothetical protein